MHPDSDCTQSWFRCIRTCLGQEPFLLSFLHTPP